MSTSPVDVGEAHLIGQEPAFLDRIFRAGFRRYLEFGTGGSTMKAAGSGFETIVAIDSDLDYVGAVRAHPAVASMIARGAAAILHADIGSTRRWGYPKDRRSVEKWHRYIASPWAEFARRKETPDLVFIDGRFRVACALSVAALALQSALRPMVLFHDMSYMRPEYMGILRYFEVVEQVDALWLLQLRDDILPAMALADLLAKQFEPD